MTHFNLNGVPMILSQEALEIMNITDDFDENINILEFLQYITEFGCPCCRIENLKTLAVYISTKMDEMDLSACDDSTFTQYMFKTFWTFLFNQDEIRCKKVFDDYNKITNDIIHNIMYENASINGKNDEAEKLKVMKEIGDVYAIHKLALEIMDDIIKENNLWNFERENLEFDESSESSEDTFDEDEDDEDEDDEVQKMFPDASFHISMSMEELKQVLTTQKKITITTNKVYTIKGNNLTREYVIRQLISKGVKKPDEDHIFLEGFVKVSETHYKLFWGS